MKHCQVTGVEMPDEIKARDEAADRHAIHANGMVDPAKFYSFCAGVDWQAKRDAKNTINSISKTESGVDMPVDTSTQNGSSNYRDAQHASDMSATCQLQDTSAEFPEAEFKLWFNTPLPDRSCRTICEYWFEKGRADRQWKVLIENLRKRTFERDQLEAKLVEANAEIERLTKLLNQAR